MFFLNLQGLEPSSGFSEKISKVFFFANVNSDYFYLIVMLKGKHMNLIDSSFKFFYST